MTTPATEEQQQLAVRLFAQWQAGKPKSQIEREEWGDGKSHGRRFDRLISQTLGYPTVKKSKLADQVKDLELQVKALGAVPVGAQPEPWEVNLSHARRSCLAALRVWNDPTSTFRTEAFALLLVTAWNALLIALIQRRNQEWRKVDDLGQPRSHHGDDVSLDTQDLSRLALTGSNLLGTRENLAVWIELRNKVAHRHLPALDAVLIPHAQAALLNFERTIVDEFGLPYALGGQLSVPLQLSGFRDPGVLASRKRLQASLPLDVQALLAEPETANPALLGDETYTMRVAFIPIVPTSGRNPDVIAYFARPGEVPDAISEYIEHFLVLPKGIGTRPNLRPTDVVIEVQRRTSFRFDTNLHAEAARRLGARPKRGQPDDTVDIRLAEYISALKAYLYTQAWIDLLCEKCVTTEGFFEATGKPARASSPVIDNNQQSPAE